MTPLVFVHGFLGGGDQWPGQDPLGTDRPLIRVDLPGFGRNAHLAPLDRIEDFAIWVLTELDDRGVTTCDLIGHSMGGMIVQDMVRLAQLRVDRLILYGTGPVGDLPGRFETIETSIDRATADGATATARRIAATWFREGADAKGYPACAAIAEQAPLAAIIAGLRAMQHWTGAAALPDIAMPTLALWGDGDRSYAWHQVAQLWHTIPDCRLAVVPNCAHAVHSEAPALFNDLVAHFLTPN